MNSSPITSWDGATAYFTFADSGLGLWLSLIGSVALLVAIIWYGTRHESRDFAKFLKKP
ncbi:hypothetical protein [Jiella sonneratiae]|uniref:Uncharacterized protein n=1 Tax=Jiella sonneratiae TaxID=2816856 RepID=A0ABS3J9Q0_9HYPH|nr:hypothetical protein [Jiella sonneratiae]MBO0906406.1 hypothetical protein [Jiella sonneratiae]